MTQSAAHAAAFFTEVSAAGRLWGIRDAAGFPAPAAGDGERAMPFWSKRSRAERVIGSVAAYSSFEPVEISLREFQEKWLPGLERDGILVGLNWSGPGATGYDYRPDEVQARLRASSR